MEWPKRCARLWTFNALVLVCVRCAPNDDPVSLYATLPIAPSLSEAGVRALDHLGATRIDQGANFSVYSAHAERIELLLFDDPEASRPTKQLVMERFGDVFNLYVEGIGLGQAYGFVAWGPNWTFDPEWYPGSIRGFKKDVDEKGHRFNPNKLLLDPYARAIHREHDWSKGSIASGPARTESTWAAAAKSVIVQSNYVWSADEETWRIRRQDPNALGHRNNDLVILEVHPKGFTMDPASGVEFPGTWRGIAEKASYIRELGANAIELMPIHEKPLDGGYWGYNSLLFFSPERSLASAHRPDEAIDEFKAMVDALHREGIEVIIDIVFNHTGEGGLWREKIEFTDAHLDPATNSRLVNFDPKEVAGLYHFRGLDNVSYYALAKDDPGFYGNNTGVGNTTRCNYRPMRRMVMDALRFWVNEMHVDGFRFDLAPVLGERDLDYTRWDDVKNTLLQEIVDDPELQKSNTRIIAEPWSLAGFYLGAFPRASTGTIAWAEWNGNYRDWWRSFLHRDDFMLNSREGAIDGGGSLTGSFELFAHNGRDPTASINFITSHDGFTLYDLVAYDQKQNGCGPLNPSCCSEPNTPFCDRDSGENHNRSRNWQSEPMKRQMMRNFFAALLLSHGTPMIYGGDEWMRTQLGNNNAYSDRADNPYNWLMWGSYIASDERTRMHDFVRKLIRFRRSRAHALAPARYGAGAPFAFKDENNMDNTRWDRRHLAVHYWDRTKGPEIEILINQGAAPVTFRLPDGAAFRRVFDTQSWFDEDPYFEQSGASPRISANIQLDDGVTIADGNYAVQPRTIVVLER